jgi:hypothetical protein
MHRRVHSSQDLCAGRRRAAGVREAVALVPDVGELPILMVADELVLPGLVE